MEARLLRDEKPKLKTKKKTGNMQSRRDLKAQHRENLMLECPDSQGESKHQG